MKHIIKLLLFVSIAFNSTAQVSNQPVTFCNPLDLPYRFQLNGSQREAADPVIVLYKNYYWLFASKSGGYWKSKDMVNWQLIEPTGLPLEQYAPAVVEYKGKLYFLAGNAVFTTDDPHKGIWNKITTLPYSVSDPALFVDDNGRIYLYHGCNENKPLQAVELDTITFLPKEKSVPIAYPDMFLRGWEVAGDDNTGKKVSDTIFKNFLPWIEGSWMNKINGKYYLQYAAPGTQFKSYGDGVFISDAPMGPFVYAPYSPFSFKPQGFVTGVGHSATFQDINKNYWHVTTVALSVRHSFERRLALFPTFVTADGQLHTNTYLGDYPQVAPHFLQNGAMNNLVGWMLLSYNKPARASSTLQSSANQNFNITNAFDEKMSTWWSASTGNKGEWLQVDLTKVSRINALQINFADQAAEIFDRLRNDGYQYIIEVSKDAVNWNIIIDRRDTARDEPHHYIQLDSPVMARYIRITNYHSPANSLFSLYDFRIFGSALDKSPASVTSVEAKRNSGDFRKVHISWKPVAGADFYIVRYGISKDRLWNNYQVYQSTELDINSLNANTAYYFTVDAVNATGITRGKKSAKIK